jgi:hypothetical protein
MTKKHFEAIARVLRGEAKGARTYEASVAIEDVTYALAALFAAENPRFNRDLFLTACLGEMH